MPPSQIFVSTRTRRQYPRRRSSGPISLVLVVFLLLWLLAVLVLTRVGL